MRLGRAIAITATVTCVVVLRQYGVRDRNSPRSATPGIQRTPTRSLPDAIQKMAVPNGGRRRETSSRPSETKFIDLLLNSIAEGEEVEGPMRAELRAELLQTTVSRLQRDELQPALTLLDELQSKSPTETGADLQARLLQRWAEEDIRAAALWMYTYSGAELDLFQRVATVWARQDPSEAIEWVKGLSRASQRETALLAIASETAVS